MHRINGTTQVVGIIGYPVGHSLSPAMHNAAFAAAGLDYTYIPFPVHPDNLGAAVIGLTAAGITGFNVTIPHKTAIMPFIDTLHESAEAAGAVNTVLIRDGVLTGYNTDGDGFIQAATQELGFTTSGSDVVIIGAGGGARGAIAALCRNGVRRIVICNRTVGKAAALASNFSQRYPETEFRITSQDEMPSSDLSSASLLVNTTSLGMNGENLDFIQLSSMPYNAGIFDMVYAPPETALMKKAAKAGIRAVNGLGMLAAQGEHAFSIWAGQKPPQGVMKRVLESICRP
ncbi:MAG TPA: shikimate dehydrogenase [Desulfuromonadales bacterium]|nr:shikimate dehydrogenase [Desulfuromonadales bacterium]